MAIVLEGLKGKKSVAGICREHQISQGEQHLKVSKRQNLDREEVLLGKLTELRLVNLFGRHRRMRSG
jgi:hypothetical protein